MKEKHRLLLSFDIEEFDLPEEYGVSVPHELKMSIPYEGTVRILDVLKRRGIPATFFVTGYFAEQAPELVTRMAEGGHEIGSHGMNHTTFQPSHLLESRQLLERMSGKSVVGFRMPRLAKVDKQEVLDAGYLYESSMNPTWLPGRYNNLGKPCVPFKETCGLWQYPVSVVPGIRFPLFWLSYKNLPLSLYVFLAKIAIRSTDFFNLYSHPWEYSEQCRDARWHIPAYITRHAGREYVQRLDRLIERLRSSGVFTTFCETL